MFHTEDEVGSLDCCADPYRVMCSGSICMAWRWATLAPNGEMTKYATKDFADSDIASRPSTGVVLGGYCGRAFKD